MVDDHVTAFQLIADFIKQSAEPENPKESELNLLEEFREIGFDKVLDTNDEFTKFKLKLHNDAAMTLKIVGRQQFECSLDSFKDAPVKTHLDSEKGFLKRIMKLATSYYNELMGISQEVFKEIDDKFLTLQPERFDNRALKRRIHGEVLVYYDYETKKLIIQKGDNTISKYSADQTDFLITNLTYLVTTNTTEDSSKECGICYSNYLDGHLTDLICPDPSKLGCKQVYHANCLREWFRANPESRTVFDKICGSCLFCDQVSVLWRGLLLICIIGNVYL